MSFPFLFLAQNLVSLLAILFALWKGGLAERLAAVVVAANLVIGLSATFLAPDSTGLVRLGNDGLAALALLAITLRFAAPWMGAVMFFYAAQFSLHSFYLVTERSDQDLLHAIINNIDFAGVLLSLIAGVFMAWRHRARGSRLLGQTAP
ncbi:MAG: hypothetical protein KGO51_11195 [Alphaproteobacteria bacterium]|nr:hypothetical protein [Alphaproteobacteria bacterium]